MIQSSESFGLKEKFKEWACSYSGCDGGDFKSKMWLCGIEWGFGKKREQTEEEYKKALLDFYYRELPEEISKGTYMPKDSQYNVAEAWKYLYGQKVAKLYAAIKGQEVSQAWDFVPSCDGSEIFRLNLYPIAFPNEWGGFWEEHKLKVITGFESKQIYRTWCFLHRFPWIAEQVKQHKPKLIIGTGVGYLTDFVVSFGGTGMVENIHQETISAPLASTETTSRTMYWAKVGEETTLVVTPFFGGVHGLNSDALIQAFGKRVREVVDF